MGKAPAFQFYPGDWLRCPHLQSCSYSTQGIWVKLLCHMWYADERGVLKGTKESFIRLLGCTETEYTLFLTENTLNNFADLTLNDGYFNIISRRMVNDEKERQKAKLRKRKSRVTEVSQECHAVSSSSSSSSCPKEHSKEKKESIKKEKYSSSFLVAKTEYPKRSGNQNYPGAWRGWQKWLAVGETPDDQQITEEAMIRACRNYRLEQEAAGHIATSYVMQMSTFFGQHPRFSEYMAADWEITRPPPCCKNCKYGLGYCKYLGATPDKGQEPCGKHEYVKLERGIK